MALKVATQSKIVYVWKSLYLQDFLFLVFQKNTIIVLISQPV